MKERVHYIDNLRWITVFLLILYHACMAYNTWDEANYIFFVPDKILSAVIVFISPWFMPLMFLLAGASSFFSLAKRGYGKFIKERFIRLGIPFVAGLIVINPVLSYIADVTHNGYEGSFFAHYAVFFTKYTDLSGYDGGFALAHLWFLLVLIVISLISCVVIKLIPQNRTALRITGIVLAVLGVACFDVKLLGKPLITYLCVYLLGYYFFSKKEFVKKVASFRLQFAVIFFIVAVTNAALFVNSCGFALLNNICNYSCLIFGVLTAVSIGYGYLDTTSGFMSFNAKISYFFYIIHFPAVVLFQYFLSLTGMNPLVNFVLTLVIAYPVTYLLCAGYSKVRSSAIADRNK
ncbi:MAG: acyltransferase family protein [Aeriscardovia sp.]|nr:acyltransferase family protein [Aeriscardovia sp.]MBR3462998.1 acyltransferase family protein [Clostridiales bacterium]